jgi:hypothetical protein
MTPAEELQFASSMEALWMPDSEIIYSAYELSLNECARLCSCLLSIDFSFLASASNARARECAAQALFEYSSKRQADIFRQSYFMCPLCFDSKSGCVCHSIIICKHVFCQKCISGFFSSVIRDGDLRRLKCPCPGCDAAPLDVEIRSLVDEQDYLRYSTVSCIAFVLRHTSCPP